MNWKPSRRGVGLIFCLLAINAVALFPLLTTGYCGDDILNSQIRGEMIQTHRTLWGVTAHYTRLWITNEGRFIPLSFYMYSIFYVIRNVILFKLFVLTVVLASLAAFFLFLRKLTGSIVVPSVCLLLLPVIFQFRPTWDPILGFCAQYPLLALLLFASLTLFLEFLDNRNHRSLAIAIVLFLCCELIFETSYLMCGLFTIVAFSRGRKIRSSLADSWPFLAITGAMILISLTLRIVAAPRMSEYTPNYNLIRVIRTYIIQTLGAVPFSYHWFDPHRIFSSQIVRWPVPIAQGLPLLTILAAIALLAVARRISWGEPFTPRAHFADLSALGVALFLLPQVPITLSPRYQAMPWGTAYLPVYLSRLGLALLAAALLTCLYTRSRVSAGTKRMVLAVMLVAWTGVFALNLRHNWLVALWENEAYWNPRVLTEEALRRGLLDGIPANSVLLVNGTHIWENANEYSSRTRHLWSVYRLSASDDLVPVFRSVGARCELMPGQQECEFPIDAPVYTVQVRHSADAKGAVLLVQVRRAYQADNKIIGLFGDRVTAYFRMPASIPEPEPSISGGVFRLQQGTTSLFRATAEDCAVLQRGRGWLLATLRSGVMLDALSIQGSILSPVSSSVVLMPKSEAAFELRSPGPSVLHLGFTSSTPSQGMQYRPISLSDEMSIDLLVTPGEEQVPYANILSNHAADFRGIAIEQRGEKTNQYSVVLGNGKEWMYVGDFSLQPAQRNYISLQVKHKETVLYVNGAMVARTTLVAPIASTDRPLYLGNWVGGDRHFNGLIGEILIAQGTRDANEVRNDSMRLLNGRGTNRGGG